MALSVLTAVGVPAGLALAATPAAAANSCGQVLIAGSSWLGGHGVDVHSNGSDTGTVKDCGAVVFDLSASPPQWGDGWQCVELVERLYKTNGWITGTWPAPSGGAESMYGAAPSNLVKEPQGSISYLKPGDAVVFGSNFFSRFGHIGVVGTMSTDGTTGQLYSENTIPTIFSLKLSGATVTFPGIATADKVIGVVHAPGTPQNQAAVTTTVSSSANPSSFGQAVTLTATVVPQVSNPNTPTGLVTLLDGATEIGSGSLSGGKLSVTTSSLSIGTHAITATYAGDSNFFSASSSVFNQVVTKVATKTGVTASPAGTAGFGDPVTFTATVSVPPPGAGIPTGTIAFTVDGAQVSQLPLTTSLTASLTTSVLSPGGHVIGVGYNGDGSFLASSSMLHYLITCTNTITGPHPGGVVAGGASTCILDAQVGGAITVLPGTALAVEHSAVGGGIVANSSPHAIQICGSTIGGSVGVSGAHGLVVIGDPGDANCAVNTFRGAMIVRNNGRGVEVIGNSIVGALVASNNSGPGPYPGDVSAISGNG